MRVVQRHFGRVVVVVVVCSELEVSTPVLYQNLGLIPRGRLIPLYPRWRLPYAFRLDDVVVRVAPVHSSTRPSVHDTVTIRIHW